MICELCHGTGHKQVNRSPWVNAIYAIPCPRCGGTKVDHCCGGEHVSDYDRQEDALRRLAELGQEWDRQEQEHGQRQPQKAP
jgi:hypothetical protein